MKTRSILSLFAILASLFTNQTFSQTNSPTVTTDSLDYPPGATVYISATGFSPNETVVFQVVHIDGKPDLDPEHQPWQTDADVNGDVQTTWYVSADNIDSTLQLTATGLTSGLVAQTTFTDNVAVTGASGGTNISADKAANAPAPAWTTLGAITIAEPGNKKDDMGKGTNVTLVLKCPAGFEFNTAVTPNITFTAARDILAASVSVNNSNTLTVTLTITNNVNQDTLTIGSTTGLQVRPTAGTPLATAVHIYRPSTGGGTAVMNGITAEVDGTGNGDSFGDLSETGGAVTQLSFTTEPATATAGANFPTTPVVKTRDQFGNNSTAGLASTLNVTLTLSSGTGPLQGTITRNIGTSVGNGTANFTGLRIDVAGADKQLTASATGVTSDVSSVFTVNPGAANKLTILTQPSATATAGTAFAQQPVIRIEDAFGNLRSTDALAITAARSGGAGTLAGTTTVNAVGGIATFTNLSHPLASNITIQFSSGALTSTTSGTVAISAGAFSKLQLLMPGETAAAGTASGKTGTPTTQTVTNAFTVTVNAVDANWNVVSANDTVQIASSDGNAVLPANAALVAGIKTFSVTLKTAGSVTVTATDVTNGSIAPNTGTATTVNPGAFVKLQLLMPGETADPGSTTGKTGTPAAQTAGAAFNVIVNAVDVNWNVVSSAHTVAISSSDPNAALPANAALVAGTKTFSVTFKTAGSRTVTSTDTTDGTKTASTSPAATVNAGAFTKLQLLVPGETASPGTASGKTGAPSAQNTDNSFNVTVNAVDANWNVVSSVSDVVGITSSDANATLPANAALSGGTQICSINLDTAGTAILTASDITSPTKTANTSPSITVNVGAFAKLQLLMPGETPAPGTATGKTGTPTAQAAGAAVTITVRSVDANWNLISTNDTVAITSSDANATLPPNAALTAGSKTFSITFKTSGTQTVTASDVTHAGITAGTGTSTAIGAGSFTKLQILVPGETAAPGTASGKAGAPTSQTVGTAFTVTVNGVDANWNVVNTNDIIRITSTDTNAILPANAALVAGTKNFSVTFQTTNGTATVTSSNVTHTGIASSTSPAMNVIATQNQTITFGALGNKVYGDAPFTVSATASSGLPVSFSILSGPATIVSNLVTITGAGNVTVRASQAGNASYNAATNVDRTFNVAPASLIITVDNQRRLYGQTNPVLTGTITGIKNNDNIVVTYQTGLDTNSPVGVYVGAIYTHTEDPDDKLRNYSVTFNNGRMIIDAQPKEWSVSVGGNGHFYQPIFAPTGIDWNVAQTNAVALGGYLATITSSNENAFVFSLVSSNYSYWVSDSGESLGPWLGAVQPVGSAEPAGGWSWVTGEPFAYQNWGPGQPNEDIPGGQDRVQFLSMTSQPDSLWNDLQHDGMFNGNTLVKSYIVEYDADPNKTNQSISFGALGNKTYGDAPFNIGATASSGLPVTFSILSGPATISSNTVTLTGAGTVVVRAQQSGDATYNPAIAVDQSFIVAKTNSTLTVASSANPSPTGSNVTLTATVATGALNVNTASGSVQFKVDGAAFGSPVVLSSGIASITTAALSHGSHTITAEYVGDINFTGKTNNLPSQQVMNSSPVTREFSLVANQDTAATISLGKLLRTASDADGDGIVLTSISSTSMNGGSISLIGQLITYNPPAGSTNSDSFSYIVNDGYGGSATGIVTVTIKAAVADEPAKNITGFAVLGNGHAVTKFAGIPGRIYTVQASTNLINWVNLGSVTAGTNGQFQFEDANAVSFPSRYYRTVYP